MSSYSDGELRNITQIAYADLSVGYDFLCSNSNRKTFTIQEVIDACNKKEVSKDKLKSLKCLTKEQLNKWSISGIHDTNSNNGFYACIVETSPGSAVIGYRGSEPMTELTHVRNDWVGADLALLNATSTKQQEEVEKMMKKYKNKLRQYDSITMTGHSLGGNLAEYATITSYKYGLRNKVKHCVSFDGPGFSDEFIQKYWNEIQNVKGKMKHYRWSFVGKMLNDLPGVEYIYVSVSNEANKEDNKRYNPLTRHDTKYLDYDENGNLLIGKQDNLSKFMGWLTEGIDHLPSFVGNTLITVIGEVWIGYMWAKENLFDEDGNLTKTGLGIVTGTVGIILKVGIANVGAALCAVVFTTLATLVVALGYKLILDSIALMVNTICKVLVDVYKWTKEKVSELREAINQLMQNAKTWWNKNLNTGYKYATSNPQITVDTYNLRTYANRLIAVNNRLKNVDRRLDALYRQAGLLDLWNLLHADFKIGWSNRINRSVNYLNDTASEFERIEQNINAQLG